ncbi:MAG TPA: hypothetical protein VLV55_05075 [Rhizomicrobium sp.]|nr:hypothetical protein [Rhizomicrobium sp.]
MRILSAAAILAALSVVPAQAGTLVQLPSIDGATFTSLRQVDNSNVGIVGNYGTSDGTMHAYVGTLAGDRTTFDAPHAPNTTATGISDDGNVAGFTQNSDLSFASEFVRSATGKVSFVLSGKHGIRLVGQTGGIILHSQFVANQTSDNLHFQAFYGKGNKYVADLVLPFDTIGVFPFSYAKSGIVVGYFADQTQQSGFILQNGTGTIIAYPDPDVQVTYVTGSDRRGLLFSGYWKDKTHHFNHPFLYDAGKAAFLNLSIPGASSATAYAMNDSDVVAMNANGIPYIYCKKASNCPTVGGGKVSEISETWTPATRASVRTFVCTRSCIGRWRTADKQRSPQLHWK